MINDTETQGLLGLVDRLTARGGLTKETTEVALEVPLERAGTSGFFEVLRGTASERSPFEAVEVRVPCHGARGGIFVGRLRPEARITEAEVRERLGAPLRLRFSFPRHSQRRVSLTFVRDEAEVTFGFDLTSRLLQLVTIDRMPGALARAAQVQ